MRLLLIANVVVALVVIAGCTDTKPAPNAPSTPANTPPTASTSTDADDSVAEGLAELPEADRAVALKQAVCPVSGDKLGSMGAPLKVTLEGRDVFLCCPGCEEELRKNPEKYLAQIEAK
jgi:YHS domain-containing protein